MPTTNFSTLVDPVASVVDGCPTPIVVNALREAAIEACSRGLIWPANLVTVTLTAGVGGYIFSTPVAESVVAQLQSARVNGVMLDIYTDRQAIEFDPAWLSTVQGEPRAIWQMSPTVYNVTPVPDAVTTYDLKMRVYLKPITTASAMDTDILNDNQDLIVHGALHRLLLQPKRPWADANMAGYHGKQFSYKLHVARSRTTLGYDNGNLLVTQRPFA